MSDEARPASTMTKFMRSTGEDAIFHRAMKLPTQYSGKILFTAEDGRQVETKYMFDSPHPIGEGGTAIVFRVRDTQLNVVRALKVLLVDLHSDSAAEKRWHRERELLLALEKVDAPCVPTIYEVGIVDGLPFIIMQFVDGPTLAEKLTGLGHPAAVPVTTTAIGNYLGFVTDVVSPIAASLAHIEKHFAGTEYRGFAHGDIKPSNIVIEPAAGAKEEAISCWHAGRVWLLDFGEASVREGPDSRGLTPAYSSPEQLTDWAAQRTPQVTPSTDQYQLGIVLQELLRPLEASAKHWHWSPRAIASAWRVGHLSKTARRMTARRPVDRFRDLRQVSKALQSTDSLPRRRVAAYASVPTLFAILILVFLAFHRPATTSPADMRDARPVSDSFVTASADSEWHKWQGSSLYGASDQDLYEQLKLPHEQWRAAFGQATADTISNEMHRRLGLLHAGKFVLRAKGAGPREQFDDWALLDLVVLTVWVDGKRAGSLRGHVMMDHSILFETNDAVIAWQPKQSIVLSLQLWDEMLLHMGGESYAAPTEGICTGIMGLPTALGCRTVDGKRFSGRYYGEVFDWYVDWELEPLESKGAGADQAHALPPGEAKPTIDPENPKRYAIKLPYNLHGLRSEPTSSSNSYQIRTPDMRLHDKITFGCVLGFPVGNDHKVDVNEMVGAVVIFNLGEVGVLRAGSPMRMVFGTHVLDCEAGSLIKENHSGKEADWTDEELQYYAIDPFEYLALLRDVQSVSIEFGGAKYRLTDSDLQHLRGVYVEVVRKMEQWGSGAKLEPKP